MTQNTQRDDIANPAHPKAENKTDDVFITPIVNKHTLQKKILGGFRPSYLRTRSWQTKASILLILAVIASGVATYAALNEVPPFGNDPNQVIWLLNIDLVILLLLVSLIARRVVSVWSGRKRKIAGSHLHVRLVYIFSLLAAVPTIIMTVFSAFFFHFGVQAWLSQRVQTAVSESQAVAQAYLEEHKQVIRADTQAMANDLDRYAEKLIMNENALPEYIDKQAFHRNLSEAILFDREGNIIAKSSLSFLLEYELPPKYALDQARYGDVVVMMSENNDRMRALIQLDNFNGCNHTQGAHPAQQHHVQTTRKKHYTQQQTIATQYDPATGWLRSGPDTQTDQPQCMVKLVIVRGAPDL